MKKSVIPLSFTHDELWMYEYIKSKNSKSHWIKSLLEKAIVEELQMLGQINKIPDSVLLKHNLYKRSEK